MEKTIIIDGQKVRLKATAATVKRYKAQFRRNLFADLMALGAINALTSSDGAEQPIDVSNLDLSNVDFELIYDLTWLYAKTADPSIPDPMTWLDEFEEFPIEEIMPEIMGLVQVTMGAKKNKAK
ncbi:hypothetical protein [Bacillus wiedmannii]|uniref:hypothetical protein n=1 Tax=Bacillus wiedmannii TaxID=1890302 RepID=UPI000BF018F6|nr:hypothetical protein [Bacillus wiedmannii]PEK56716.1 hypothetical protein CN595_29570 [Bacillus wiedmannii]PEL52135.1 hypothetical protein CN622_29940 [Bacillus wiedmannii]